MPSRRAASASARTITRAAAASASWRSSRGVVPAWSARPASSTCSRSRAARRVTTPAGRRAAATSRVWSMCSSRKPRSRSSHSGALASPAGSTPAPAIASPSVTPWSSMRASASSTSSRPASAREPNVGVLKRAPSSSANEMTATGSALGDREAGGDAERAVEAPARAHGVEVRAGRPPRARRVRAAPTGCRRGRARAAGRSPPRGARTSPPPARPRRSTPAASWRRSSSSPIGHEIREQRPRARRPRRSRGDHLGDRVAAEAVGDVLDRRVEQDEVGALADLDRAAVVVPEHPGGVVRAGSERLARASSRSGARPAR